MDECITQLIEVNRMINKLPVTYEERIIIQNKISDVIETIRVEVYGEEEV